MSVGSIVDFIFKFPRRLAQGLIRVYQKTLSPDQGFMSEVRFRPTCRFHPTCSNYAHEAIGRYGLITGGLMAAWRVLRCHPWSKGGHDPVP